MSKIEDNNPNEIFNIMEDTGFKALLDLCRGWVSAPDAVLEEAIARSMGFPSKESFYTKFRELKALPPNYFAPGFFKSYLGGLGYPSFKPIDDQAAQEVIRKLGSASFYPKEDKEYYSTKEVLSHLKDENNHYDSQVERHKKDMVLREINPGSKPKAFNSSPSAISWSLGWTRKKDTVELRLGVGEFSFHKGKETKNTYINVWGRAWPETGIYISSSKLLGYLTSIWPVISQGFSTNSTPQESEIELSDGVDPQVPSIKIAVNGRKVRILSKGQVFDPQSESLLVLESLKELGNKLSELLKKNNIGQEEILSWNNVVQKSLIPPIHTFDLKQDQTLLYEKELAKFYASILEIEYHVYEQAAFLQGVSHILYSKKKITDSEYQQWNSAFNLIAKQSLPKQEIVDELQMVAVKELGDKPFYKNPGKNNLTLLEELQADWLSYINLQSRSLVYFDNWPSPALADWRSKFHSHQQESY